MIDGHAVSGLTSKAVLRAIDDHGKECWAGAETIANEVCTNERCVRRALKALSGLRLISTEERSGKSSVYRIQWRNFALTPVTITDLTPDPGSDVGTNLTPDPVALTPDPVALTPDPVASNPGPRVLRSVKKRKEATKKRNTAKRISTNVDESLFSWITFWNSLKDKGLVSVGASEVPSEGVVKGWKRVQASKVLQELLADKDALERKIRESAYLHSAAWFNLAKLFGGKNSDGEFIVRKILASGYMSNGKPTANVGAGVNFDPNKDYSNAKF